MAYDANAVLQASVTKTATFTGTGINLLNGIATGVINNGGTPSRGLAARVNVTAISGAPAVVFKVQHSDDNSTYYDLAFEENGVGFSATTGQDFIVFATKKSYVRLVMTLTGGSTPSITYDAQIGLSYP